MCAAAPGDAFGGVVRLSTRGLGVGPPLANDSKHLLSIDTVTHRTPDVRRALIERVGRTLQGEGVPRQRVASAVDSVLAGLDRAEGSPALPASAGPAVVAAFTARSAPDLASRVRRALEQAGVPVIAAGSATSGRHTVVTARVPAASREALAGVATGIGAVVSVHPDAG
jgi:hypothetical protein